MCLTFAKCKLSFISLAWIFANTNDKDFFKACSWLQAYLCVTSGYTEGSADLILQKGLYYSIG